MGIGFASAIVSLLAVAASTYVAYQGQQYQKAVAKQSADYNSKLQENQAIQADLEARENVARERARGKRFLATQRASRGKSGITEAGSPLEVMGETAGMLELQAQDAFRAARAQRLYGFAAAANTRAEGAAAAKGYGMAATGTLISGAASAANSYGNFKYTGAIK